MYILNEFFEYFNIPKIEYREPGRTVDDNGDICEWYIDYDYPSVEPVFMDLLNYYNMQLGGTPLFVDNITEYKLCKVLADAVLKRVLEMSLEGDVEIEKQEIREIFTDYYGGNYGSN